MLNLKRQVEVDAAGNYAISLSSVSNKAALHAAYRRCTYVTGECDRLTGVLSD